MPATRRQQVFSGSDWEERIGFARATRVGPMVAISGTAPIGSDGRTVSPGDAAAQARRCLEIIREAMQKLGAGTQDVIRTRIYVVDAADAEAIGAVHSEFFGRTRPAATMVVVAGLLEADWLVEIEAEAFVHRG